MKRLVLVGTLVTTVSVAGAFAQGRRGADSQAGHTAPKAQPATAPAPSVPTGEMQLGSVRIPKGVKVGGSAVAPGTYQVRLTAQAASPEAKGQTAAAERYVEFLKGGKVVARDVATIIPQSEIDKVQKDAPPKPNGVKVETLKGGDYVRVWINKGGNHFLLHLPTNA